MDHFNYQNQILHAEDVSMLDLAREVGTPFYCYSSETLVRHYHVFADAFTKLGVDPLVCFSVKCNSNVAVLRTLANEGAGGDCVSGGEILRCIKAGIDPKKIIFSGVGKTEEEMRYALEVGIYQFNVESEPELRLLDEVATSMGVEAPIALRINPDVDAGSHDKITTGRKEDKFGIAWDQAEEMYDLAARLRGIEVVGVTTHIGSQLTKLEPFQKAFAKISELVKSLRDKGHNITHLDLGGGLGIPYESEVPPLPRDYAKMVVEATKDLGCDLSFEPGRLIAGNAGILVSKIIYPKPTPHKNFLIIDAAMNDLLRPALYDAYHEIIPVLRPAKNAKFVPMDVVGPVCESGDCFAKNRPLPSMLAKGELVAIRSVGAYGAVMSSTYNTRPLIPEVLVSVDAFRVIRPRVSAEDLIALERFD